MIQHFIVFRDGIKNLNALILHELYFMNSKLPFSAEHFAVPVKLVIFSVIYISRFRIKGSTFVTIKKD